MEWSLSLIGKGDRPGWVRAQRDGSIGILDSARVGSNSPDAQVASSMASVPDIARMVG